MENAGRFRPTPVQRQHHRLGLSQPLTVCARASTTSSRLSAPLGGLRHVPLLENADMDIIELSNVNGMKRPTRIEGGSQFTGAEFIGELQAQGIEISMDEKSRPGQRRDNASFKGGEEREVLDVTEGLTKTG